MLRPSQLYKNINGFTLIEVLITVMITGILAAIATPSLLNWYNNKKIEDVTAQVEGALKIAQSSAVKNNSSCNVTIAAKQVSATPSKCLPEGIRFIQGVNANLSTQTAGTNQVSFTAKGSTTIVASAATIVIYDQDAPTSRKMRCIVIASGVGLMRTGIYEASSPPASGANADTTAASCITPI